MNNLHEEFDRFEEHMAQELVHEYTGWICSKCGVDRLKEVCPKGHSAALTGDCPMVGHT
jgi:hypothetical protein